MGKRAEKPENNEQPPSASEPSSGPGEESQAAAGGSTEHKLPVVWSPKLDAGGGIEDEFFDAEPAPPPPDDEAAYGEAAKEEPSAPAAPAAQPRSWRFALLAATIAVAAAAGSFVGSLTGAGVGRLVPDAAPSANTADANSILRALKSQVAELTAMKSNLDGSIRNANTQFVAIAERLDRVERAATNPAAQLAHIADAVDRLNKINATPETTGSIAPMTTPPAEPKIVDRIVEDWVVQDVHGDRALVEGRNGSLFEVGAGSILPGVGRVEAVKRQDGQWVVVTARGVITSGR
ncbi:MAG TPA: hypothetical protein VN362_16510 [Xanthobacteraceae bacterium]|jgi:hypothetical protein|nr:hypothetical protein [Xanthobacteraceae bacterium]